MIDSTLRVLALLSIAAAPLAAAPVVARSAPSAVHVVAPAALDTVVFAGGCFWGVQAVFQHVRGVVTATSGYAGGTLTRPGYEQVSTGTTGHAEAVRVVYDPSKVSYGTLLDVFFTVAHDPTELNRQGPDVGTQYRSAIFFTNPAQHQATASYVSSLDKSGKYKRPVVTQISALKAFYPAESYHQDYATLHPDDRYIAYNDAPKVEALRRQYASIWNDRIAAH
jgi:peptide-methionine (S)-S-oxide reductase